ncbi:hypothetical protein CDL15_Pgr005767 [Punica granatum]|uniref:GPI ethanolamine phosphate transferase 1 n=1 Tax=Punica granatum TaxID=22663 RepID=A0A218WGV6_PUNGR|nr:hypothetical protein CDL15_Pgr005767 [Punica granatum]
MAREARPRLVRLPDLSLEVVWTHDCRHRVSTTLTKARRLAGSRELPEPKSHRAVAKVDGRWLDDGDGNDGGGDRQGNVKDKGSWMEIGNGISHFGIVSAQVVFVLLLFALTDIYTKDIQVMSNRRLSPRKAM